MKEAFKDSVDDYLEFCASRGENAEKPFSGKSLVRVPPELHRQIMSDAIRQGKSLNAYVMEKLAARSSGLQAPRAEIKSGSIARTTTDQGNGGLDTAQGSRPQETGILNAAARKRIAVAQKIRWAKRKAKSAVQYQTRG